jgi:CubicO group peptidase (beta-lactamase class C family)
MSALLKWLPATFNSRSILVSLTGIMPVFRSAHGSKPIMSSINRRTCLQRIALTVSAMSAAPMILPRLARAEEPLKPSDDQAEAIAGIAGKFMAKHDVPGLSVAFAHLGKPAFRAGYGLADQASGERMTGDHLFRIASISKPITAVAVFLLVEQGRLKLDDKVFGKTGHLADFQDGDLAADAEDITIHHLLTHTCGGWRNDGDDPMFRHPKLDHRELIARTLRDQPLKNAPGKEYAYSNFGYCLLGRVIEKISGKLYDGFVNEAILRRCGIQTMKLAGNTLADRVPGEVVYHGRNGEDPYRMNVRRMDAHGGWLASPADLVKFLIHCDGSGNPDDRISKASFKSMMTATQANPGYASGWSVNAAPNFWHGGSLPGTATIAVQTASGMCWAGFANSRSKDVGSALDRLMWEMARAVPEWKA